MKPFSTLLVAATLVVSLAPVEAERLGYPPEEFTARRQALAAKLGSGLLLMMGETMPAIASRFRQDNDFFYLSGSEDLNAVLVMDAATADAHLFLPKQNAGEIRSDGRNWLEQDGVAERRGFRSIQPLDQLTEFLARWRGGAGAPQTLWMRLSEADEVSQGRNNKALNLSRKFANPFGGQPSEEAWQIETVRSRYPFYQITDVTPHLDRLRIVKTAREIEILTENGRISAEAILKAMEATRPGAFEYELEAEATYHHVRHGVQSAGYGAIVGSGGNGNVWHYRSSGSRLAPGEMVVMDYGGALDYLVIDVTRTWPVSGQFDDVQLKAYRAVLEAQKAIIAAMRPGATRARTREIAAKIFEAHGFPNQHPGGAGHFVGMSVHDVGDSTLPFEPGMVIAVEPIIEIPERGMHVRIEDSVLVTDGAPVVLTAAVPKEVDEVLAVVRRARESSAAGARR